MSSPAVADIVVALRALGSEMDRLDEVAAQIYGLNRTDMRALEIVGRAGPIAPSELARLLGFTTGGATTVIDRLERAGCVTRHPHPGDRRRLTVETTGATRDRDRAVFGRLMEATAELLGQYSELELQTVAGFLDGMRAVTAACTDQLAAR